MPLPCDGGVVLCNRGFNPIDVLVEDALVDGGGDNGDTVEQFTDFIDSLLTQVDTPSGAPLPPPAHARSVQIQLNTKRSLSLLNLVHVLVASY